MDANDRLCWYRSYDILTNVVGMCCPDLLVLLIEMEFDPKKLVWGRERRVGKNRANRAIRDCT